MRSIAALEPPAPVRNISSSRPAFSIAATTPSAMSSSCVYTASIWSCAWRMFSITDRPLSGTKSAGWHDADADRLRRPAERRMGGLGHGPRARRTRVARVPAAARLRSFGRRLRRRLLDSGRAGVRARLRRLGELHAEIAQLAVVHRGG